MLVVMRLMVLIFLLAHFAGCAAAPSRTMITFSENPSAVLHNPDMGWVLYENYPLDPNPQGSSTLLTLPGEHFDGVDHVAIMFSWQDIEKKLDQYDFTRVDRAYDYWKARGKQIQLRLSTESLVWWTKATPPAGKGIPDYVLERIPKEKQKTRLCEGIPYVTVDARDFYYLERLNAFLAAINKHFDERRPVTMIDLRGFGLWGEWHSGYPYASLRDRREALMCILDRWVTALPGHQLALSYSYDPDGPKELWAGPTNRYDSAFTETYEQFLEYSAFDIALSLPNIAWRRDGAGGAVHSNERRLCEEAFTCGRGPFMSEFVDGYASSRKGKPGWIEWKIEDALSLHPNYVNLLGWQGRDALAFLKERLDLIEHGLKTMGYRLLPRKIAYPSAFKADDSFTIEMAWQNLAVGRAVHDFHLTLLLVDASGATVAVNKIGPIQTSRWAKGQDYFVYRDVRWTNLPRGRYELRMVLEDPATKRVIQLPIAGRQEDGSYTIGPVEIW